jgi:hypothetical protein
MKKTFRLGLFWVQQIKRPLAVLLGAFSWAHLVSGYYVAYPTLTLAIPFLPA